MRLRFLAGGLAGLAAAVIWSVTLAVYQPLMEPHGVWKDPSTGAAYPVLGDNNTYWPRDIRQLALLLAFASIVLICSASRRGVIVGALGAGLWFAADLVLDRLDATALVPLMIAAIVWFGSVAAVAARGAPVPAAPVVRTVVATITAVLAPAAMIVTTPWDEPVTDPDRVRIENALSILQIGLVVLALAVAVGIAGVTARSLTFVGVAGIGATLGALAPYQTLGTVGVLAMAVAAVLAVSTAAPSRLAMLGVTTAAAVLPFTMLLVIVSSVAGTFMTWVAANPAVNSADTDMSLALAGLGMGVLFGFVNHAFGRPVLPPQPAPVAYN
jgi:hypothetical protein